MQLKVKLQASQLNITYLGSRSGHITEFEGQLEVAVGNSEGVDNDDTFLAIPSNMAGINNLNAVHFI